MTRREAKAVEILRSTLPDVVNKRNSDAQLLGSIGGQAILEAMAWQAQESADDFTVSMLPSMITERQLMSILNAGKEEV
jgi:hypothetical protein